MSGSRAGAAEERLMRHAAELRGLHVAHDSKIAPLRAVACEEGNRRWPNDAEVLKEGLIGSVILRHIGSQQDDARERRLYRRIRKGVTLHFLAGDAPVRVEIEQHRMACRFCGCDFALQIAQ